jgi:hypothetical protein
VQSGFDTAAVLDRVRASRAAKAYRRFMTQFCASLADAGAQKAKLLQSIGLRPARGSKASCPVPADDDVPRGFASGAFDVPGADEVLLMAFSEGPEGVAPDQLDFEIGSGQIGATTLALMRAEGGQYRFVRHLSLNHTSNPLDVEARILTPSGRDVLLVCGDWGRQGVYPGTCGFLGQGDYRADATDADSAFAASNQFNLVYMTDCERRGPIAMGDIALQGNRIVIPLNVLEMVREPGKPPKYADDVCAKGTKRKQRHVTLEFEIDPSVPEAHGHGRVRLLTPVPKFVSDIYEGFL